MEEQTGMPAIDRERAIDCLFKWFGGRRDAYVVQYLNPQTHKATYTATPADLTQETLALHVDRRKTIGVYPVVPNTNRCQWGVLDVDSKCDDAQRRTLWMRDRLRELGLQPLLEDSGNKGYHVVLITKKFVVAEKMRLLIENIRSEAEAALGSPEYGVEIRPLQGTVKRDKYGNPIKLPFGVHRATMNNIVFVEDDLETPLPNWGLDVLDSLTEVGDDELDAILSTHYKAESTPTKKGRKSRGRPRSEGFDEMAVEKLLSECAFMVHCRADAATLPEPEWHAMVCQLAGFGERGAAVAHAMSTPHSGYTAEETENKLDAALIAQGDGKGAHSCDSIEALGFTCPPDCRAKALDVITPRGMAAKLASAETALATVRTGMEVDGEWTNSISVFTNNRGRQVVTVNSPTLGEEIMTSYNFLTMRDTNEILVYGDGVYTGNGERTISEETTKRLGNFTTANRTREVTHFINTSTGIDRTEFDKNIDEINLENGILNLETLTLDPHSPNRLHLTRLPLEYHPEAKCPAIERFLGEVLYPDDIPVAEEFFGYCLRRTYDIHRAIMLMGGGSNAKTTFLGLLTTFLGEENCCSASLQALNNENMRFVTSRLYGKLACIYDDISSTALRNTGEFKVLTGSSAVFAERKGQNPFEFKNYAKLIFSANQLPDVGEDDSFAFWRRWILLSFPNQFTGDRRDPNMLSKLTTKEELSGLLNLALRGLQRLMKNGDFSYSPTPDEVAKVYTRAANPVYAFATDRCKVGGGESWVETDELYTAYINYCKEHQLPILTKEGFGKGLKKGRLVGVYSTRKRVGGIQRSVYAGIELIDSGEAVHSLHSLHPFLPFLDQGVVAKEDSKEDIGRVAGAGGRMANNPANYANPAQGESESCTTTGVESYGNITTTAEFEESLGVTIDGLVGFWKSNGAPVVHLGPGENCFDLVMLLSGNPSQKHLQAVHDWFEAARS